MQRAKAKTCAPLPQLNSSQPGVRGVDVRDRFDGALMGFLAGCGQAGIDPNVLISKALIKGNVQAEIQASSEHPAHILLLHLWNLLPEILLRYPSSEDAPSLSNPAQAGAPGTNRDRLLDAEYLQAITQILYGYMTRTYSPIKTHSLETHSLESHSLTLTNAQMVSLPPRLDWLQLLKVSPSLQWQLCFDSLMNFQKLSHLQNPDRGPSEEPLACAVLGLWIGSAHGIQGIPLTQQLPLESLRPWIRQRVFQLFLQWAGSGQSYKVSVS